MQDNQRLNAKKKHNFSDHELVAAFIEKRLSDNLAAFKKYLPDIYEKFKTYREERFFLIYDHLGHINLIDRENEKLIFEDPVRDCLDNLKKYEDKPVQRPYFIAKKDSENKDSVNYVHSEILGDIGTEQGTLIGSLAKSIVNSIKDNRVYQGYSLNPENCSFEMRLPYFVNSLFCLSSGLGFDLEKLYLERDIRHLHIVEPSSDVFYASMQLADWASILKKSEENGYSISFTVASDFDELIGSVSANVTKLGRHNVAGAYLYSAFYLPEYKELFESLKSAINYSYLAGFGFYDDSRYSLAHTMGNVVNNVPLLASNRDLEKDLGQSKLPVMVVGNGPSLDKDIQYIRDNQQKFVVVSCGSALRSLIVNSITPDFHIELERTASIPHWIKKSATGIENFFEKLKEVTLIEVSQVHPDVPPLFKKSGMVLKDIETGSSFINHSLKGSGAAILPRLAPTCVHTAVTVMAILGFRRIYLFGTDMGSADPDVHHSRDSSYQYMTDDNVKKFEFRKDAEIFSSNFGDKEIYSSGLYPMFKRELESVISGWKYTLNNSIDFHNCSDGAFIKGTEPKVSSEIDLDSSGNPNKTELLSNVFDAFFSLYPAEYTDRLVSSLDEVKDAVDQACDYAIDLIHPVKSIQESFELVDRFTLDFHSDNVLEDRFAWLYSVFDGSLLYMLSTINSSAMLPLDDDIKLDVLNRQFQHLKQFFITIKKDFRENCLEWDKESRYEFFK